MISVGGLKHQQAKGNEGHTPPFIFKRVLFRLLSVVLMAIVNINYVINGFCKYSYFHIA
jgi:hypothetical protein